jgi:tRNA-splicing ligase RtcB (3'-phosphate/5'-hydroxy nucleic acid ligase)
MELKRIHDHLWEIPRTGGMRVPGRIFADAAMLDAVRDEGGLQQVVNVAHLPGIVGYSMAMPDIHWGYGFPIGGVAATDPQQGGVISPGGVGYDINCGVRLCSTRLVEEQLQPRIDQVVTALFQRIPCGVGSHGGIGKISPRDLEAVLTKGAAWAIGRGLGSQSDLEAIEDGGGMPGADPMMVSDRAKERGLEQIGTLGSGNHFVELGVVEEIYHPEAAASFGLIPGGITLLIHTGSRGLGYQVCDDYLKVMARAVRQYGIELPDRQLACAPVDSSEGKGYLAAMACAANFAWANRQAIASLAERALLESLGMTPRDVGLRLIYDVSHNIAKLEDHPVGGKPRRLCVHRKGATRAHIPHGRPSPWPHGQPVIVPGDMGSASYLCVGTEKSLTETWGSSCHGAGRVLSRTAAKKKFGGRDLIGELKAEGITVMAEGRGTVAEEMRGAYKDVSRVVAIMEEAGISRRVARLRPLGVIKG